MTIVGGVETVQVGERMMTGIKGTIERNKGRYKSRYF